MKRRLLAVVGGGALVGCSLLAADSPPPTNTPAALVSQLGSDRYDDREAAMKALEAAGPSAIPALEAAVRGTNPEVARRAAEILAKLRRSDDSAQRLAPKTVRLAYKDVPLGVAVNDLKARTGLNVALDPAQVADPTRAITCETGELPVWEAVEAFCKAAGVREVFRAELDVPKQERTIAGRRNYYTPPPPPLLAENVPITLVDGKANSLPGSRSTAVRVLALPGSYSGNRVILGTGDVTLHFDVTPAPGLNWQEVIDVKITKVIDDAGRAGGGGMPQDDRATSGSIGFQPFGGVIVWRGDFDAGPAHPASYPNPRAVPVPIKLATPTARSLKVLEGAVVCEVMLPNQTLIAIDDPMKTTGTAVDGPNGTRLTILDIQDNGKGRQVMRVQFESPSAWAAQRRFNPWGPMWPEPARPGLVNRVLGTDASGKVLTPTTTQGSDNGITSTTIMQFTLPQSASPITAVKLIGPKPVTVEIPFKMQNVTLP